MQILKQPSKNFFDVFFYLFNNIFPEVTRRKPGSCRKASSAHDRSWYSAELANHRALVQIIFDRYKSATSPDEKSKHYSLYQRIKKHYKIAVDTAKREGNVRHIKEAKNPCKAAWNIVNCHRKVNSVMNCVASPDDFNNYFVEAVDNIVNNIPDAANDVEHVFKQPGNLLSSWFEVSPEDIVKLVKAFKPSTSPDIFGMTVGLLKAVIHTIASPLAATVNKCLAGGVFPAKLKISRTVPIFKKGSPESAASYRPIAVIPIFGKLLETIMQHQLVSHFDRNMLFADSQHGFRKERSTTTAVSSLAQEILTAFENKNSTALILCDLSKAFDCVSHRILLDKLKRYGLRGSALGMMHSYLANRVQIVSVSGARSRPKPISHGVPQGSVLGPTLFLVMINDLDSPGTALLFADDTTLFASGVNPQQAEEQANKLFETCKLWFSANRLKLNEDKTQKMTCTLSRHSPSNDQPVKLLGFCIDPKLSWDQHIRSVSVKLGRVVFLLRKLRGLITEPFLLSVYHALFHSHVAYGIRLWGHAPGSHSLLLLQKKALRTISLAGRLDHCRPLFRKLGILTIHGQYIWSCLWYVKSHEDEFVERGRLHSYNVRNAGNLNTTRCRLSKSRDSFPAVGVRMFNHLPALVRDMCPTRFRSVVREWLKDSAFYSVSEFFAEPVTILC